MSCIFKLSGHRLRQCSVTLCWTALAASALCAGLVACSEIAIPHLVQPTQNDAAKETSVSADAAIPDVSLSNADVNADVINADVDVDVDGNVEAASDTIGDTERIEATADTLTLDVEQADRIVEQKPSAVTLSGTIRDFKKQHPDFEIATPGRDEADKGIVRQDLGKDQKPIYTEKELTPTTSGKANFDQWYRNVEGINKSTRHSIRLQKGAEDTYIYVNKSFFPIDDQLWGNGRFWHNYHFTYEIHATFLYQGGEFFEFEGDDDFFLFINKKLAIDLGGLHVALKESVVLDQIAQEFELTPGNTYEFDLFFAERHTTQSSFNVRTTLVLKQVDVL